MDHITAKHRSYAVRDAAPRGTRVRALQQIKRNAPLATSGPDAWKEWRPQVIETGEVVTVRHESNAGFRGIEFSVTKADGDVVHGVSAGLFEPV